jgi:hypothetical protein
LVVEVEVALLACHLLDEMEDLAAEQVVIMEEDRRA